MAQVHAPWPELTALAHAVAVGELDGDEAIAAIVDAIVARELAQATRTPGGPAADVAALRRSAETTVRSDRVLMAMLRPLAPSASPEPARPPARGPTVRVRRPEHRSGPEGREDISEPESDDLELSSRPFGAEMPSSRALADAYPNDDFAARQRMRRVIAGAAIVLGGVAGVALWAMFLRETPCERLARQVCLELTGGCSISELQDHIEAKALDAAQCDGVREAANTATAGVDGAKRGKVFERAIIEGLGFDPRTGKPPVAEAAPEKRAPEPLVIASGVTGATSFAVDEAFAFWTMGQGTVARVRNVGGTAEAIAQTVGASDLVPAADFVYWRAQGPDGSGALWVDRKRGTYEPQTIPVGTSKVGAAHCMQGECVFVDTVDGAISAVVQDGTAPRKLTGPQQPAAHEVRITESEVFWAVPGTPAAIASAPLAGGASRLLAGNEAQPRHLRVDESHVYWIAEGGLRRVPRAGGDVETVVARPIVGFALDGARAVISDAGGTIAAVATTGGEPQMLANGQTGASWVAVDGAAIYWIAADSVVRLPK